MLKIFFNFLNIKQKKIQYNNFLKYIFFEAKEKYYTFNEIIEIEKINDLDINKKKNNKIKKNTEFVFFIEEDFYLKKNKNIILKFKKQNNDYVFEKKLSKNEYLYIFLKNKNTELEEMLLINNRFIKITLILNQTLQTLN